MKRRIIIIVAFSALAAGTAYPYLGQIVTSFPAPLPAPVALACGKDDSQMWVYCGGASPFPVWRINSETGSIYGSFVKFSGKWNEIDGLAYTSGGAPGGDYLWLNNVATQKVFMCNPTTGSHYLSWRLWHGAIGGLAPLAYADGGYNPQAIIATDRRPAYTYYHLPTTGSLIASHPCWDYTYDVAWDWRNDLIWGSYYAAGCVCGLNTSGSVVATFPAPGDWARAMTYRGEYLWVGCSVPSLIYKIHCPVFLGVAPASLGRVKALFR